MTIQRITRGYYGMDASDHGDFVHYCSHVEVVRLIHEQLDLTQKQLERAQEQIRILTEALSRR